MKRGSRSALWAAALLIGTTASGVVAGRAPGGRAPRARLLDRKDFPHAPGTRWTYRGEWTETLTLEAAEGPRSTTSKYRGTEVDTLAGMDRTTFAEPTTITQSTFTETASKGAPLTMTWQSYSRQTPEGVLSYGYKVSRVSGKSSDKLTRNPKPTLSLKLPLTPGMKWNVGTMATSDGLEMAVTATVSGPESLRVGAGRFRDCLRVTYRSRVLPGITSHPNGRREIHDGSGVQSSWFAPGVGMVKDVKSLRLNVTFHPENGTIPLPGASESRSTRELTAFRGAKPERAN